MASIEIGKLLQGKQERDAIHIAIAPMIAVEKLYPGQSVGISDRGVEYACASGQSIGIVDPFLAHAVLPDQRFWLFLHPNTITSLRHDWTHPMFNQKSVSQAWIEQFCIEVDCPYDRLMQGAKDFLEYDEYLCEGGRWEGVGVPDEFWEHYQTVTGEIIAPEKRGSFFTCTC